MTSRVDVAVIGSGPSGTLAASTLVAGGATVLMLDVANDDARYRDLIPDLPFSELRRTDAQQRRYFLGDQLEGVPAGPLRVGAQLTPPRQYVTRDTERLSRTTGEGFEPMQSLALGGLGAAWGAAVFTFTRDELERAAIYEPGWSEHYDSVAREIGVSGGGDDDSSRFCFAGVTAAQPPLDLDSVCSEVWTTYLRRRTSFNDSGLLMGRTPLAALSRDLGDRRANPYFDMDFWGDSRRSVFRPRFRLEALERDPRFTLERRQLVRIFESDGDGVSVRCHDVDTGAETTFFAKRVVLCAGAINSARIALASLGVVDTPVPILCNPYVYLPSVVWRMLGRASDDRRHSLSQLTGIFQPQDDPSDFVTVQFYGYRSLLLFKLVKEMPLPPWAGLLVARSLVNSLAIVGLHHSDSPHHGKSMRILDARGSVLPVAHFDYRSTQEEMQRRRERETRLIGVLRQLGVLPISRLDPGAAASIHYAGTLPVSDQPGERWASRRDGRLWEAPHVYVGDSASWRYLPAKGLTFTIMANARRVATHVLRDLRSEA